MIGGDSRERTEAGLRHFAGLQVRAGLLSEAEQHDELVAAIEAELPPTDAAVVARAWLVAARRELVAAASSWPEETDHDRLQAALSECAENGVRVVQGADDLAPTPVADPASRGTLRFSRSDVWQALESGVLRMDLHPTSGPDTPAGRGLLTAVLGCLARHGLTARHHEGRIEVATRWQRRPA